MDSSGQIIGRAKGDGTNHQLLGMKECRKRIADLIDRAKLDGGLPTEKPLDALVRMYEGSCRYHIFDHDFFFKQIAFKSRGNHSSFFYNNG